MQIFKQLLIVIGLGFCSFTALAKSLAFSFDDGVNPRLNPQANLINSSILNTLQTNGLKSIIFPAIVKIGDADGLQLVMQWGKQGHLIGNHSYSHRSLNAATTDLSQFIEDTQRAELILKPLTGWTARLRFPYLKEGESVEKRDGLRHWLTAQHYQSGAVSIDASDWYYNQKYLALLKDNETEKIQRLKQAYIAHLLDRASYYDQLALQTIQRSPRHMLLLHSNAINAAFLQDAIDAFKQQQWQLIDASTAFKDALYQMQANTLPAGESILWALAKQKGVAGLRYPAEDSIYEEPLLRQLGL